MNNSPQFLPWMTLTSADHVLRTQYMCKSWSTCTPTVIYLLPLCGSTVLWPSLESDLPEDRAKTKKSFFFTISQYFIKFSRTFYSWHILLISIFLESVYLDY